MSSGAEETAYRPGGSCCQETERGTQLGIFGSGGTSFLGCGHRSAMQRLVWVQDAILRGSGFQVRFQRQPNSGRCFPAWERPWIGDDRTLKVTYYANGTEDDLANNSQYFFEQVGLGIVLAHVPDFVDKTVQFSMTLQSFHRDYP